MAIHLLFMKLKYLCGEIVIEMIIIHGLLVIAVSVIYNRN